MILGTASDVGKSIIQTALCRLLYREHVRVTPLKSLNMTRNVYPLQNHKLIATSQVIQAFAANIPPSVWINPIVLKPNEHTLTEIIILGEYVANANGFSFREQYYELGLQTIKQSLARLASEYDCVLLEGSGSPVEMYLRDKELIN